MVASKRVLLVFSDESTATLIERSILAPQGYQVTLARTCKEAESLVERLRPDLMMLGDNLSDGDHIELATTLLNRQPTLPIILFTDDVSDLTPQEVIRLGLVDWISPPINIKLVQDAVDRGLQRSQHWQEWLQVESSRYTGPLLQRVDELEALSHVGRSIVTQLDLENILTTVLDAAIGLTMADEGSILLLDEDTGELYMRASRNVQDDMAETFRLPVKDTIAGKVLETGQPVVESGLQKLQTSYLVNALIYVPIQVQGKSIGVLGVDNREAGRQLDERFVPVLSALADYAAVAMENARLYAETELERSKLERIITQTREGVLVIDQDQKVILTNKTLCEIFNISEDPVGKSVDQIIQHQDLLAALQGKKHDPERIEVEYGETKVYQARVSEIPNFGKVATLHDISYLKELDRLKTDFLNTVSHDLRSPLTAILGYVELIQRTGEINDEQKSYIKKVQTSVNNITELISDLLDLGKIEVGVQIEVEKVPMTPMLTNVAENLQTQIADRKQTFYINIDNDLPAVNGSPVQLRQVFNNLLDNAIKYTPIGGEVILSAEKENGQLIVQVADNGPGIPADEQTKIFDKFYRAKNVKDTPGTGLGLAITKSIIDNHNGRIWVTSSVGEGAIFTVVLPTAN